MNIGIPKESNENESRVAATPITVDQLLKLNFDVLIESSAGTLANFSDSDFSSAGAIVTDTYKIWKSDIILKINAPTDEEINLMKNKSILICFIWPTQNSSLLKKLIKKQLTVMAMDAVPRISRAQSLDALSSMANVSGYRAIIEAAYEFGRFFNGQVTAAGKILPAKVMVIGAGVAGLSAIGTAKSLGAVVYAFDSRNEVKEQIKSMGAEFLSLNFQETLEKGDSYSEAIPENLIKSENILLTNYIHKMDIVVSTALIPGKPAPCLITKDMVTSMKSGSVIVDLAIKNGGNCELTVMNKITVTNNGIRIIGYSDFSNRLPMQSSQLYGTNVVNLIKLLCKEKSGEISINFNDPVIRSITVMRNGELTWPAPSIHIASTIKEVQKSIPKQFVKIKNKQNLYNSKCLISLVYKYFLIILSLSLFSYLAIIIPHSFFSHFTVFSLACIVGYYVVCNISNALHAPLMSVTNAISGVIIVGALLQINHGGWISYLSFIAILISSINIFGGFTITQRMLKMFLRKR